jgi:coenzyme F420 hydrogenase subunit beta
MAAVAVLPILMQTPTLAPAPHRDLCTDCGVSRSSHASSCGKVCQFIHPRYDALERQVHGRTRASQVDESFFGPFRAMHRARLREPLDGAQWTGITTRIAERLLETGAVDAVIATASDPDDRWRPRPAILTRPEEIDEAAARGYRRLAVVGVACQEHALRALESELGLERLYVLGTPCSDNTTTERFHQFLGLLTERPETVTYLEFLSDFRVEVRFDDGRVEFIPFMQLPISQLPSDFFPVTCRACFDYTNSLSDLTVGYMAGEGEQWLIVRTARGEELMSLIADELALSAPGSAGDRTGAVRTFVKVLERSVGGLPVRRAPKWVRPLIGWAQRRFGPKGLEFARTRVEMKMAEGILTLRQQRPHRMKRMIPSFAWDLVSRYGIAARPGERMEEVS